MLSDVNCLAREKDIVWLLQSVCFLLPVLVETLRLHHNSLGLDRGVSFAVGIRLFLTFPQRLGRLLRFPSSLRAASFPVRFLAWKKSLRGVAVIVFLTSSVQFSVALWWNRLRSYADAWRCARRLPPRTCAGPRSEKLVSFSNFGSTYGTVKMKAPGEMTEWNVSPIFARRRRRGIKLSPSVCTPLIWSGLLWQKDSVGCKMVAW